MEGASFREAVMPKISVSVILIRVADPLKSVNLLTAENWVLSLSCQ